MTNSFAYFCSFFFFFQAWSLKRKMTVAWCPSSIIPCASLWSRTLTNPRKKDKALCSSYREFKTNYGWWLGGIYIWMTAKLAIYFHANYSFSYSFFRVKFLTFIQPKRCQREQLCIPISLFSDQNIFSVSWIVCSHLHLINTLKWKVA